MSDLSIVAVETTIVDVPLVRPHRFATTSMVAQPILLVGIATSGGVTGHGEGVVPGGPWWGGESVETMRAIVERYMVPVLLGRRVDEITAIMADIERVVAAARFAKAAVDVALHDAWARCLDVPVHTLLGGAFRSSVDVTWALGSAPVEEIINEAREKIASREHFSFKLKMGALEPGADTDRVLRVTEALAEKASIRVDVNARWDRITALRHLPRLVAGGVELIEQPTPGEQLETLAELNALLSVPVMADESVHTPYDALEVARRGAADVLAIKTTKCGGLRRSREVVAVARAAGLACHGATSIEGPIGTAASIHFACSEPGINFGTELFGPLLFSEELLQQPLRYAEGQVHLPTGPGLGVELNMDAVKRWSRN
ncbi:chloromuconate cycloisomerase [Nocardia cyriacigeorgica]|uniref:muconate/chloromuconate family cycloisomerase n=1 Tax=Nocardia cyriacigeorgica TaxID=135487 RepID=UPI0018950E83|nr:muconate/chloromuconate family cycloisomerase [Nocardia cyriacigeorgica]MBF6397476.1 chloromuconate cycloisomerase [Nocardia cyriacigeorgica]MBF6402866.1 chloromuconate cycloisomerase [Nocardia cyriacigeorgica]